ncbi:SHOCT domain-containing protein [Teredinibacter haidensis]|uniref:SHOCT domain-containing protein n=1 Tax=Teredinibacter haidensis TaxID=2731755 RepID=UPI000948D47C|nr:SHOCT domain-containing protein [Teredinibacter haidensis]
MQQLTSAGENIVSDLSNRYNLSREAIIHMLVAVNNGGGTMAQFNCPELGGGGQWMRGGMTMVGDMFNHGLKMTVDNLCSELSSSLANMQLFPVIPAGTPGSSQWWPADCGTPFSSGAQNNIRYAVFPGRLAVELNGQVTVYDTLNHHIGGVSQQQGSDTSLTFSSQLGTVSVTQLPIISGSGSLQAPSKNNFAEPLTQQPVNTPAPTHTPPAQTTTPSSTNISTDEIIKTIEKLAGLRDAGAINEEDFNTKKKDLLSRI